MHPKHLMRLAMLSALSLSAMAQTPVKGLAPLRTFNDSIDQLIQKVSPSVVHIMVTGFDVMQSNAPGQAGAIVGRQRGIGSGFVIDPSGYIMTNAHVVKNALKVQVMLPRPEASKSIEAALSNKNHVVSAKVIGVSEEMDLALLKVEAGPLPALKLAPYRNVRQGELVFAFGSPEGLRNSVTMGMVSNIARQTEPDSAMVYIQTDASINPGNSGGPLVNADGEVVGVNTFIMTQSGGSEGLGFAIPSTIVDVAYKQIRKTGRLRQVAVGMSAQTITPTLAEALHLSQDSGLIISDVAPRGPADKAGLQMGDVLLSIDNKPVEALPYVAFHLLTREVSDIVNFEVMRDGKKLLLKVPVAERPQPIDKLTSLADPEKNVIPSLGIVGLDVNDKLAGMNLELRDLYGVLILARTAGLALEIPLQSGDVIREVNGTKITGVEMLRSLVKSLPRGSAVALQVQREQQVFYMPFVMEMP